MPTYDYECDACGHKLEIFQSITAEPLNKCPECKKKKLRRLLGTGAALMFKGSGFYTTDYRSEGYKKRAEADKKSSEGGSSDSATKASDSGAPAAKSESKSEAKAEGKSASKSEAKSKAKKGD
jgi:putative FmdB family regulatory protein